MMSYIIIKVMKNKEGVEVLHDYYAGLKLLPNRATDGIVWSPSREYAYEFAEKQYAQNFLNGTPELRDCVIEKVKVESR